MSTRQDVMELVVNRLRGLALKPPFDPNSQMQQYAGMVNEIVTAMLGFSAENLKTGMDRFVADWKWHKWPLPGQLTAYMLDAEALNRPPPKPQPKAVEYLPSPEHQRLMQRRLHKLSDLMRTGRIAKITTEQIGQECEEYARSSAGPLHRST
jgi:hypothetical protein